ncbi:MAG: aminotransferase class IV [Chloroflexi bacterium]|nr:aminotransferase class IV [Chloroflexota bacterium]
MIYLNGEIVPAAQAHLSPADRGFLLGDGLFETLRTYQGTIAYVDEHLERLAQGAVVLHLPMPLPISQLAEALQAVLDANQLSDQDSVLRLTLTRGPGPRGLLPPSAPQPTLMITATPLEAPNYTPIRAVIAAPRRNENSPLANIKSLNYLDNILARQQAHRQGAEEALLLNAKGNLASASAANLFIVADGILMTPPTNEGALPGITRSIVLECASALGIAVSTRPLAPADLLKAQEAFLTNTLIELRPLVEVDSRPIGAVAPGPITLRLLGAFHNALPAG